MLWSKESNKNGAMYVDMFALRGKGIMKFYASARSKKVDTTCNKSDATSFEKRTGGNEQFKKQNWEFAMGMYNESLSYAEQGSANISLAYANRSACFFHMKNYKECLVDIELARKAGYPTHLMPKLDQREAECMKLIECGGEKSDDMTLKLSFDPDEQFPCMANVLKIDRDANGKLSLFAKEDIDVGQTIVVEKAFTKYLYSKFGLRCSVCLKSNTNLLPCNKCTIAMFCSEECRNSTLHDDECGLKFSDKTQVNGIVMNEVRIMLMVIRMFPNIEDLIKFVEQAVNSDPNEVPDTMSDEKSKYRAFLKLSFNQNDVFSSEYASIHFCIYKMLIDIPKINAMFNSKKYRNFLMHLVLQHALITDNNSTRVRLSSFDPDPENRRDICSHTGLISKYLQHHCGPNVFNTDIDGHLFCITIRPVKRGEQLYYSLYDFVNVPKAKRQQVLWESKQIICKCSRCDGPVPTPAQRKQLKEDPLFRQFNSKQGTEECLAILRKYGHGQWYDEIKGIIWVYTLTLLQRFSGTSGGMYTMCSMLADSLENK